MKFPLFSAIILGFLSLCYAIPIPDSDINFSIERTVHRANEINNFHAREWLDLERRIGPFANTNQRVRNTAHGVIEKALRGSQLAIAATPSHLTGTYLNSEELHLDRQQPTNIRGDHKVAIQLNRGSPSTIGQVVINKDAHVSPKMVAARLKHSVNKGEEMRVDGSMKMQRIAANHEKHLAKQQRHKAAYANGMANAARGNFRKGRRSQ